MGAGHEVVKRIEENEENGNKEDMEQMMEM